MTNVEKLKKINHSLLNDIRDWLGAENKKDETFDDIINDMTHDELMEEWCQIKLGDRGYWHVLKNCYNGLENLK